MDLKSLAKFLKMQGRVTHIGPVGPIYIGPRRFLSFTTIQQLVVPNRVLAAKQVIDWLIQSGEKRAQNKRCGFLYFSSCCCNCIAISSGCVSVSIDAPSMGFACRVFEGLL